LAAVRESVYEEDISSELSNLFGLRRLSRIDYRTLALAALSGSTP